MARQLDPVQVCPDAPGISKRSSPLAVGTRWIDSDKVLFVDGKPEKFPGWTTLTVTSVTDPIRGLLQWSTLELLSFFAMGTHRKLYVVDFGNDPADITPIESTGTLTNPFSTVSGSATVTVADTAHGRHEDDEVRFDGATAVGGITIDGAYQVSTLVDDDSYTIEHTSAALTTAGPGGGSVDYEYEIPVGTVDPIEGDGYGVGGYGLGDYGEPSEDGSTIIFEPRVWSLAQNGDLLYANPLDGGIFVFDPADTPSYQRAEALTNAPTVCRGIIVTPERFLFALGVDNDPLNIKWPDQDDHTDWTPLSTNTANSRRLTIGTRIIGAFSLGNGITGVWTDRALYRFQYTGSSFVYNSAPVGQNCGLVSPMAVVQRLGVAYWMSRRGFHMWGGGGAPQFITNSEDVSEYVIRGLRQSGYEYKCNGFYWPRYDLVLWCYVPTDETEPGLYAGVCLKDNSWIVGTLERTSGVLGLDERPVLASADGWLIQHEDGLDADGEIMQCYIERAPLQLAGGVMLGEINGVVTDMQRQIGTMSFDISTYDRINDGVLDTERIDFEPGEDLLDPSIGGRIAKVIIRSEALGGDFRIGAPLLHVMATGKQR